MKRTMLLVFLFLFAGALLASARVAWIPTTAEEIVAYKQGEMESVGILLMTYDTNGSAIQAGKETWGGYVNSTNLFVVMTNCITKLVSDYLTQNDPGTNKYNTVAIWEAPYFMDEKGHWMQDGVSGQSPDFQFQKPGPTGLVTIPAQAYNIQVDWIGEWLILSEIGQGVKWVEYYFNDANEPGMSYDYLTPNGAIGAPEWARNGVLFIPPSFITFGGVIASNNTVDAVSSITFWYDDAHTYNGTRWTWVSGSGKCVKTEIYPPVPTLSTVAVSNGVSLMVSGGYPQQIYVLEGKETVDGKWTPFAMVLTDGNGGANWFMPTGVKSNQFIRARMAGEGEFPPKKLSIFSDGARLNLFMLVPAKDAGHLFFGLQGSSSPAGPFKPVAVNVGGGQKVFMPNAEALAVWRIAPNPLRFFRVVAY